MSSGDVYAGGEKTSTETRCFIEPVADAESWRVWALNLDSTWSDLEWEPGVRMIMWYLAIEHHEISTRSRASSETDSMLTSMDAADEYARPSQ